MPTPSQDWIDDCLEWWGGILTGRFAHWCAEWDDLPIDETCQEFEFCGCYDDTEHGEEVAEIQSAMFRDHDESSYLF